jgi:hypothetical protein
VGEREGDAEAHVVRRGSADDPARSAYPTAVSTLLALAACIGPYPYPRTPPGATPPKCDLEKQDSEEEIDAPFDVDRDGYVDGANPDCAAAYLTALLDCDDTDPMVHPIGDELPCNGVDDDCYDDTPDSADVDEDGFGICEGDCADDEGDVNPSIPEACGDHVDNDCDDDVDEGCPNFQGYFLLTPPFYYDCGFGSIHLKVDQMHLQWTVPYAAFENLSGFQPPTLEGQLQLDGTFDVEAYLSAGTALSCDEHYRLFGQFTDEDHFDAYFTADYTGGVCGGCSYQSVPVSGIRYGAK